MNTAITVSLSECGGLTYFAVQDAVLVVEEADTGIVTNAGEHTFAYKPSFLDADKTYTAIICHENVRLWICVL